MLRTVGEQRVAIKGCAYCAHVSTDDEIGCVAPRGSTQREYGAGFFVGELAAEGGHFLLSIERGCDIVCVPRRGRGTSIASRDSGGRPKRLVDFVR